MEPDYKELLLALVEDEDRTLGQDSECNYCSEWPHATTDGWRVTHTADCAVALARQALGLPVHVHPVVSVAQDT